MIVYGSIYGNTENAVNILACKLAERRARNIVAYDVFSTHPSITISEAPRCSHLASASATHNGGIFSSMEHVFIDLKAHNLQNRTVALMENGSWGVLSGKQMKETIGTMKNMTVLEQMVTARSSLKESQMEELDAMADAIVNSMKQQYPIRGNRNL